MRNVWDKSCRENPIHIFRFNKYPPRKSVSWVMWNNTVELDMTQMTIRRMHLACWITKATKTFGIINTCCFPKGTVVTRTHLRVSFTRILPVLLLYFWRLSFCSSSSHEADMRKISYVNNDGVTLWHWSTSLTEILMTHISIDVCWYFGSRHHHHHHALTDLYRPRLTVASNVFQAVFVHLVYSTLFLASSCSFS